MNLTDKKIIRVARAICYAAGTENSHHCVICDPDNKGLGATQCIMIEQFKREAEAAIKAMKGF
jgi:hypothetical protein